MKALFTQKLPIAMCYLAATTVFAQTSQEALAIKKKTAIGELGAFNRSLMTQLVSSETLRVQAKKRNIPYRGKIGNQLFELQGFSKKTGVPLYYMTYNAGAAIGTSANKLHSSGGLMNLDGEDIIIYEWDGAGANPLHREFQGRVVQGDQPHGNNEHSAHVAGTLVAAGIDSRAKGMAPKAHLFAFDWNYDTQEMIGAIQEGAIISNHSYGVNGGFEYGNYSGKVGWHWFGEPNETEYTAYGHYNEKDLIWDLIALKGPYFLPVKAAGNSRGGGPEPGERYYKMVIGDNGAQKWEETTEPRPKNGGDFGYDTLLNGSLGKNVMIVGAAEKIPTGYKQPSDVVAAKFSVFGPTDDGRIKPDIMGIGVGVYSTHGEGENTYFTLDGTSMAAPNVTGSLALVQEHYRNLYGTDEQPFMKSATLKGLAIHTADEAGEHLGPDYKHGWGLLNVFRAAQTLSNKGKYTLVGEHELVANTPYEHTITASGTEPLKVTISWDDAVLTQAPEYILDNEQRVLVNDLDVRIYDEEGTEYKPWVLDPKAPSKAATQGDNFRDNVEQVLISNPMKGKTYTIKVFHKGNGLKTNHIDQQGTLSLVPASKHDFSMVVSGINDRVETDLAITNIELPDVMAYSEETPVKVKIQNLSNRDIAQANLSYRLINNDDNNKIEAEGQLTLNGIPMGQILDKEIFLNLSKAFVNYTISLEVSTEGDQVNGNNKQSVVAYGVVSDLTKESSQYNYDFEDSLEKIAWTAEDLDGDHKTWRIYTDPEYARTGNAFITNFPNAERTNDWIFTNPLKMKAGEEYRLIFNLKKIYEEVPENINVGIGNEPKADAMATMIVEGIQAEKDYTRYIYKFVPAQDGIHYIGFNHKQEATTYSVAIDDVSIQFAKGKPAVNFYTKSTLTNSHDPVAFINETETHESQPTQAYEWSFEPQTVTFAQGNAQSKEPQVVFTQEGTYDVTLKATNAKGESSLTKRQYITTHNLPLEAGFSASETVLYEGELTRFVDYSQGNPAPYKWEWIITPTEEIEFVEGTTAASQNPIVRFNKPGNYDVTMRVSSPVNSQEVVKKEFIEVRGVHHAVNHAKISLNQDEQQIQISWKRPNKLPLYEEGFEKNGNVLPSDFTIYDEDGNNINWDIIPFPQLAYSGKKAVYSPSLNQDVSNWMVTGAVPAEVEELSFWYRAPRVEYLDVYLVPARGSGQSPSLEEIKNGTKIYEINASTAGRYVQAKIDVSSQEDPFHVVFHHRTQKIHKGREIMIDEIRLGFKNQAEEDKVSKQGYKSEHYLLDQEKYDPILTKKPQSQAALEQALTRGVTNFPRLSGYEVVKTSPGAATIVKTTGEESDTNYQEEIHSNGVYIYEIYALYTNGKKSKPVTVSIDVATLSTAESKAHEMRIYPNPSDGRFVIDAGSRVSALALEVYDLSGKRVFKGDYNQSKVKLDLTKFPKGGYILSLVDNHGRKQSAKLIIN